MKKAYIISTGNELLSGATRDSNAEFLTIRLMDLGIQITGKSTVGDDQQNLIRSFATAIESSDLVISTGGLGPTFDDLTKTVACKMMECDMELRREEEQKLRDYFANRHRPMPEINLRQAMFPAEAVVLKNVNGTAPGMYLNKNGKILVLLPGPPREMTPMFLNVVEPLLINDFAIKNTSVIKKTIKTLGLGESQVEEKLGELINTPPDVSMALLANDGEVHIKLLLAADSGASNPLDRMEKLSAAIEAKLGKDVFGLDDETLVTKTARLLLERQSTLAAAESCTGGLLGKMLTDLPGSSNYFWGGVISYSNTAKQLFLGVSETTLAQHGAVSPETAQEMAEGLRVRSATTYALSITGIAGPEGGSQEKPVGLVYIALAYEGGCQIRELRLGLPDRDFIRILSAKSALDLLRRHLEYNQLVAEDNV